MFFFKSGINRFVSCLGVEKGVVCEKWIFFQYFLDFLMKKMETLERNNLGRGEDNLILKAGDCS